MVRFAVKSWKLNKLFMDTVIWKDIPNFKGKYSISNSGEVKSAERNIIVNRCGKCYKKVLKEKILKPFRKNRYKAVQLDDKIFYIHHLSAITFLEHVPNKINVIDHIDNDPHNNNYNNLQIISHRINRSKDSKKEYSNYVGVYLCPNGKWRALIGVKSKLKHLGYFHSEIEAHKAYTSYLNTINNKIDMEE